MHRGKCYIVLLLNCFFLSVSKCSLSCPVLEVGSLRGKKSLVFGALNDHQMTINDYQMTINDNK